MDHGEHGESQDSRECTQINADKNNDQVKQKQSAVSRHETFGPEGAREHSPRQGSEATNALGLGSIGSTPLPAIFG